MTEANTTPEPQVKYSARIRLRYAIPAVVVVLGLLFISVLPLAVEYGAKSWLQEHGVSEPQIENIDINLFTGEFIVEGLKAGDGLRISRLAANLDWLPLFGKVVHIQSFALSDSTVELRQTGQDQWQIGDIRPDQPASAAESDKHNKKATDAPWLAVVEGMDISALNLKLNGKTMQLQVPVDSWQVSISAVLNAQQTLQSSLKLGESSFSGSGHKASYNAMELDLKLNFSMLAEDITASLNSEQGVLKLGAFKLHDEEGKALAELSSLDLRDIRIDGLNHVRFGGIGVTGVTAEAALTKSGRLSLERIDIAGLDVGSDGRMAIDSLALKTLGFSRQDGKQRLSAVDSVELLGFAMAGENSGKFDSLRLDNVKLPASGNNSLGSIGAIIASAASFDAEKGYHLKKLQFNDLSATLTKHNDGRLLVINDLAEKEAAKAEKKQPAAATKDGATKDAATKTRAADAVVVIDELLINPGSRFVYRDYSISPALHIPMRVKKFRIAPLDLSGKRDGRLDMRFVIGKAGELTAKGKLRPHAEHLKTNLVVKLKDFDLTGLSGFVESDFGKSIASGQFNLDSDVNIADNIIRSNNRLLIRQLTLGEPTQPENKAKSSGMPIEMAISLIQDEHGNINLQVPVEGDLNKPDVGLEFNQALTTSLNSGAIAKAAQVLQPHGTIIPADKSAAASEAESKARLTPIIYPERAEKLSPAMADYVSKIALLLKKQKLRLQICGIAARMEGEGVNNADVPGSDGKLRSVRLKMGEEALLELADARAEIVTRTLLAGGVAADRLSNCAAEFDAAKSGAPRVEILLD